MTALVFVGLAIVGSAVGFLMYSRQAAEVRARQGTQLSAVRDLKSAEITRWMHDQQSDAILISGDIVLGAALEAWIDAGHEPPPPPVVGQMVGTYRVGHEYASITVLDSRLEVIYSSPARSLLIRPGMRALAREALREDRVVFSDIFLDERGRPMMDFLVPVRDATPSPDARIGVYKLGIDLETLIFPLIEAWPTASRTAETLLVERRGDHIVYLNDLRRHDESALRLTAPTGASERPAVMAAAGRLGVVEGVDYSGARVLAAIGPVQDTPWYLVAKIDRSEVEATLRGPGLAAIAAVFSAIIIVGMVLVLFWWRRENSQMRSLYEAERDLRASQQRFRTAFEHAPVGVSFTRPDGSVGQVNATLAEMLGYSIAGLESRTVAEITYPDDRAETADLIRRSLAGEIDGFTVDKRYLRHDGSDLWTTASVTLLRDEQDRPESFVAMISDISARRAAEEALQASEARFRGLFTTALIGFALHEIVLDPAGDPVDYVFLEVNEAFGVYTGLLPSAIVGRRVTEIIPGAEKSGLIEVYGRVALGGEPQRLETYFEPFERYYDIQVYSPQPGQFATAFLDVTERVRAQQTLAAFFESQGVGLGIVDRELRFVRVNETFAVIDRTAVGDHHGRPVADVVGDLAAGIVPAVEAALRGEPVHVLEVSGGTAAGPDVEHHWLVSCFPVAGEGDHVDAVGLVAVDISARREAERDLAAMNVDLEKRVVERTFELEHSNRELEAFSYSVSHDLRAPLRALDGFSLALMEDYGDELDDAAKDYLARIRAASQRMGRLIDDMLALSRVSRQEMDHEPVDLSALARGVLADLKDADPERVVVADVADGLAAVGDPALLRVVLQNLLSNAWKFTSRLPEAHIEVGVDLRDGVAAYFVRDDGAGFDATYVDKLFKPFQRLHAAGEFPGTGVGLATVQRIVRRHGGTVWAVGAIDCGATFYFTLD